MSASGGKADIQNQGRPRQLLTRSRHADVAASSTRGVTRGEPRDGKYHHCLRVSSRLLASIRSDVSEPSVNQPSTGSRRSLASSSFALIAPKPRHADRCAQLERLRFLLSCDRQRAFERRFRFRRIRLVRHQRDIAGDPMDIGFTPLSVVSAAVMLRRCSARLVELTDLCIGAPPDMTCTMGHKQSRPSTGSRRLPLWPRDRI